MKKPLCIILLFALIVCLCGCNSFELSGIENFNENDCIFGLNDRLLPNDRNFLNAYPYEKANYYYWRNEFGPVEAKTFVCLQYSIVDYPKAKAACEKFFSFSNDQYICNNLTFHVVNIGAGDLSINQTFPGFRMVGYDDSSCMLVFIGYLNEDSTDLENDLITTDFSAFFNSQFGEFFSSC